MSDIENAILLLRNLPNGSAPKWTEDRKRFYMATLADIPAPLLCRAIRLACQTCEFQPAPVVIRKLAEQINSEDTSGNATAFVAKVVSLMLRLGPYAARHPRFPDNPNVYELGVPHDFDSWAAPEKMAVTACGGWVAMCQEDIQPGILRAQLERLYKGAVEGIGSGDLLMLRDQYREEQRLLAAQSGPMLEYVNDDDPFAEPSKHEAAQIMAKFGGMAKGL